MKQKNRFLFILCLTGFFTVGVPGCEPDYYAIRDITRVEIFDPVTRTFLHSPGSTTSDSISLVLSLEFVGFSMHHIRFTGMMNEAWATSPEIPILANEIRDIRVFSDQPIYGFTLGENISSQLEFGFGSSENFTLSEYLEMLPGKGDSSYGFSPLFVNFTSKPIVGFYSFTVEIEDNNGHVFTSTAPTLEWL